jgi:hypothetical protein
MATKKGATEGEGQKFKLPEIKLLTMTVPIRGLTALLTNRIPDWLADDMEIKNQGGDPEKRLRTPNEQFEEAIYRNASGECCFPAAGIKRALVEAGGRFTDMKMTELRGIINVRADLLPILGPPPKMRRDYGRNRQGMIVVLYRPCWEEWSMQVPVAYNASCIKLPEVVKLFQLAGFGCGIGCWRPDNNGTFGTFTTDLKAK